MFFPPNGKKGGGGGGVERKVKEEIKERREMERSGGWLGLAGTDSSTKLFQT